MTENAKVARLWSRFHHLAEDDKDLVVKVAETVKRPENAYPKRDGKDLQDGDSHVVSCVGVAPA